MIDYFRTTYLLDFYGALLTARQRTATQMYFEENLTLSEIAEELSISRQAIHDTLRRANEALENYESKLGLVSRFE
ncbi:MAG: sigma factor-like helix-turn-helix DNA-binding protein, partial [bacterium]|nr:sigma factor-like helix-turn-helix DNA-binding protein [bacterium]